MGEINRDTSSLCKAAPIDTNLMSDAPNPTPPRAFTQGVGTVFQFAGVILFTAFFSICCLSALLSKETAMQTRLGLVGWGTYTAQRAMSVSMAVGVLLGIALTAIGLGLQARKPPAPAMAVSLCLLAGIFWMLHAVLFIRASILLAGLAGVLAIGFVALLMFSIWAWLEMRRNPPPAELEILPPDYKVPYSHLHQDPPEVRLARELEQRRQKIQVQQKELEMLEEKLNRKMKEGNQ